MPGSLASKVRAKFPGAYDDLTDADLEAKVLAAHPEYRDLATPGGTETSDPGQARMASLSKTATDTGWGILRGLGRIINPQTYIDANAAKTAAEQQAGADAVRPQSYSLSNLGPNVRAQVDAATTGLQSLSDPSTGGEAIGSLVGMLAVPALRRVSAPIREAVTPFAEGFVKQKLGIDPDAINLAATRLKLQAAKSGTRQMQLRARIVPKAPPADPNAMPFPSDPGFPRSSVRPAPPPPPPERFPLDPHAPSTSGYNPSEIIPPPGPLPTSSLADVERHLPNTSGYNPQEIIPPQGPLPRTWLSDLLDRYAPSTSGYQPGEIIPPQGPLPTSSLSAVDPHMPNVSGYQPGEIIPAHGPQPTSSLNAVDRYAPSISGYVPGDVGPAPGQAIPGVSMPQATYVKLDETTWGIKGPGLVPGTKATVMSSAGVPRVVTVGEIYDDAHGIQTALIGR